MKSLVFILSCLFSIGIYAQENEEVAEEFIPINIEGKDAFMSTKTGEYTYREHAKTDPTQLKTTASGVIYTDISSHTVKKGETLSAIAKKTGVTISDIKKHNKVTSSNLKIGSNIKIVKKMLIKSSSPVKGTSGDERIIARLRPGESPGALAPPPPMDQIEKKLVKTEKTRETPLKPKYKVKKDIKNPMLGLGDDTEEIVEETEVIIPTKETKQERLKRLKAEMKVLEAELEEAEEVEVEETEEFEVITEKVETKAHDAHDGHDHSQHDKEEANTPEVKEAINKAVDEAVNALAIEDAKEIVEETEEVYVPEVKETVVEESLAKKASRVVSQVKKTNKEVEVKKPKQDKEEIEEVREEKDASTEVEETEEETNSEDNIYIVERGNSLWYIAKMHNMTVDELKKLNKLESNYLDIGQKLKVNSKPKK